MVRDDSVIGVEVVYAQPARQTLMALTVPVNTTAYEAILRSGVASSHPEIELAAVKIGIFGKRVPPGTVLKNGDRVEIYRPLTADPKEARHRRARKHG